MRSAQRDETWFSTLYAGYYPKIVNYGRRRLADVEAAHELAQDVFVVAWRRRTEVPPAELPWLYGVARRLLANRWRAGRASPDPLPLSELDLLADRTPEPDLAVSLADVRVALAGLSELDQEILRLVGWEELAVREAAVVLGCTPTAAAVRLHRARRRLTEAMARVPPTRAPAPDRS